MHVRLDALSLGEMSFQNDIPAAALNGFRKSKNYLNVSVSRMLKKAEANIRAVEKGIFPVGH
tara:strand:+ start:2118 stop:2303 length:186 start_codon:yes stop_codon:yes gene_type:complete